MKRAALIVLAAALALAGCNADQETAATPREPDVHSVGYYCGMTLSEHAGPKGQLLFKDREKPLWFTSVRDAFVYLALDLSSDADIAGLWVNDMGMGSWEQPAPGSWIAAADAVYVLGSNKTAAMGGLEVVPFRDQTKAAAFAKEFGGRVVTYAAAREEVAADLAKQTDGGS